MGLGQGEERDYRGPPQGFFSNSFMYTEHTFFVVKFYK